MMSRCRDGSQIDTCTQQNLFDSHWITYVCGKPCVDMRNAGRIEITIGT